jgi:hypothetical protein
MDWLAAQPRPPTAPPRDEPGKPNRVSREETQHWLEEFGDLADDPGMKELFDPPWSGDDFPDAGL